MTTTRENHDQGRAERTLPGDILKVLDRILQYKNIAIFSGLLAVVVLLGFFLYGKDYFDNLGTTSRQEVLFLSTFVLVVLYGIVFTFSFIYRFLLRAKYDKAFAMYHPRIHQIPKVFSVWILPIISILLVIAAQIVTLPTDSTPEAETTRKEVVASSQDDMVSAQSDPVPEQTRAQQDDESDSSNDHKIRYSLSFTISVTLILLMIGMELSYMAQEHRREHKWAVLVLTSLILDFVSYLILIVGLKAPSTHDNVHEMMALYTLFLGCASAFSSFFTVTQARISDEVLNRQQGGSEET